MGLYDIKEKEHILSCYNLKENLSKNKFEGRL